MSLDPFCPAPPNYHLFALQVLWSEGGIKRFYKGFTPCLIRAAPANAAMLFTVDRVTAALSSK